jgi:hypothetical protein
VCSHCSVQALNTFCSFDVACTFLQLLNDAFDLKICKRLCLQFEFKHVCTRQIHFRGTSSSVDVDFVFFLHPRHSRTIPQTQRSYVLLHDNQSTVVGIDRLFFQPDHYREVVEHVYKSFEPIIGLFNHARIECSTLLCSVAASNCPRHSMLCSWTATLAPAASASDRLLGQRQ